VLNPALRQNRTVGDGFGASYADRRGRGVAPWLRVRVSCCCPSSGDRPADWFSREQCRLQRRLAAVNAGAQDGSSTVQLGAGSAPFLNNNNLASTRTISVGIGAFGIAAGLTTRSRAQTILGGNNATGISVNSGGMVTHSAA
jgi:hypothetical protein